VAVERQQRDRRLGPGGGPWFLAVAAGRIVFTASGRAFVALVEVCTVLGRRVVAGNRVLVCRSGWWQTRVAWREGMAARAQMPGQGGGGMWRCRSPGRSGTMWGRSLR